MSKRTRLIFALFFFFAAILFGQEFWYQAYDAGIKAIKKKDWKTAETKLKIALSLESKKHGKGIDTYGFGNRIDYFPNYYLGVVYFEQGKYEDAITNFETAEKLNLSKEDGGLYASLLQYKNRILRVLVFFVRQDQKQFQASTYLEFGCEQLKSATVSFQLPPGALLVKATAAWGKVANADSSTTANPVVVGNIVSATGGVRGLSRISCTGNGHAELALAGEYAIDSVINSAPKIVYTSLGKEVILEELSSHSDISRLLIGVNSSSNPNIVSKIEVPVTQLNVQQTIQRVSIDQKYQSTLKANVLTINNAEPQQQRKF